MARKANLPPSSLTFRSEGRNPSGTLGLREGDQVEGGEKGQLRSVHPLRAIRLSHRKLRVYFLHRELFNHRSFSLLLHALSRFADTCPKMRLARQAP